MAAWSSLADHPLPDMAAAVARSLHVFRLERRAIAALVASLDQEPGCYHGESLAALLALAPREGHAQAMMAAAGGAAKLLRLLQAGGGAGAGGEPPALRCRKLRV